jgi:heme/copper-type cytochrome/quinol oxidase subunit 2
MQNRGATKMDNFDLSMFLFGLLNGIPWGVILALIVIASCGRRRKNEKNNDNFRNDK